ncbi:MAG TPA: MFS transporter [Pseudonocardiaceae bacterium]|jgi:MFS family permease|nr:MFS transporter [Pseudonocardiaceae bacterium]
MRPWIRVAAAMFGIGWGANQFSSLLLVYRGQEHLPQSLVAALFGAYAVGLIPALLIGASCSDRLGRVKVIRPVLVLSIIASLVLLSGPDRVWTLVLGRLLAGVASGVAFGPGTAWIKELSADAEPGSGARRAAIALSSGFGGGPLVAGLVAQWLPLPAVLPYLAHIALMLVIIPIVWRAPETVTRRPDGSAARRTELLTALGNPAFLRTIVPTAPLVFGTAAVAMTVIPEAVPLRGFGVAASGVIAGLTLAAGIALQPLARALQRRRPGSPLYLGLGLTVGGFALAALTVVAGQPVLMIPTALVLGGAYGTILVAGLNRVEALAGPDDLASVTAVFYCLTYLGFATPFVAAALSPVLSLPALLLAAAVVVILVVPLTVARGRVSVTAGESA